MRASVFVASVAAVSSASALLAPRQYEGCETECNPMQDWAFQCRTDVVWCQNQCNAELLTATDSCFTCIKEKNPDKAGSISQYVGMAHKMCGSEATTGTTEPTAAVTTDASSAAPAPSGSADATDVSSAAPTGSVNSTGSAAAPTGSSNGTGAASPTASTPAASSSGPSNGAAKVGASIGAIALAISAFIL